LVLSFGFLIYDFVFFASYLALANFVAFRSFP
jgi:hypothetical protein